jgi:glucose/arabinose dehydrogenase
MLATLLLVFQAVQPAPLAAPFATPWFRQGPRVVAQPEGAALRVPDGFRVQVFADGLQHARKMALAPNGDVFLAERNGGQVTVLRDADGDGVAERKEVFASGLTRPFGLAFQGDWLYVGNNDAVVRFRYAAGQLVPGGPPEKIVDLPASDSAMDEDTARRLNIDVSRTRGLQPLDPEPRVQPDGRKLYVGIGSATNATPNADVRRAAINEYDPDGSGHRVFASGLRNPVGMVFHPDTRVLWAAVQERDHLGDELVPGFLTSVQEGGFYGWPYAYIGAHPEPILNGARPDLVQRSIVPEVLLGSHSAAMGIAFYTGSQFPPEYSGSAFVAMHGSINRSVLSGYSVVRIPFRNGRPSGPPSPSCRDGSSRTTGRRGRLGPSRRRAGRRGRLAADLGRRRQQDLPGELSALSRAPRRD